MRRHCLMMSLLVAVAGNALANDGVWYCGFDEAIKSDIGNQHDYPKIYDKKFHLSVQYQNLGVSWNNKFKRRGKGSLRIELDAYDVKDTGASRPYNYRCEIVKRPWHNTKEGPGTEKWIGLSLGLPKDWVPDTKTRESVMQIHAGENTPPFIVIVEGSRLDFENKWGDATKNRPDKDVKTLVPKLKANTWYDIIIRIVGADKSNKSQGITQVWVNGKKRADWKGQNLFDEAPYIGSVKLGVYKWYWKQERCVEDSASVKATKRVYHYDEMREYVGKNGYKLVDPSQKKRK